MNQSISEVHPQKILRTVSFDKVFHFTSEKGVYTGIIASSLSDFAAKLETIDD
jgi:hypothetical protein